MKSMEMVMVLLLVLVGKILLFLLQQIGLETISHIPDYLGISLYL